MESRSVGLVSLYGALVLLIPKPSYAHLAHPGYSGLISTPNAEVIPQGQLALNFSWVNGPRTYLFSPQTNRLYVVTMGILPGLEGTLRQTQVIGWHDPDAPGVQYALDRMFSAKYRLPMPKRFPSLAIGAQDIASANLLSGVTGIQSGATQYGQSTYYGVLGASQDSWDWHFGFGISQGFINGFFGGMTFHLFERLKMLGEWDSKQVNWGLRFVPIDSWWLQISGMGIDTWGLSSGVSLTL
ncbi:hypothetical protein D3C72_128740 [compost metagenome]